MGWGWWFAGGVLGFTFVRFGAWMERHFKTKELAHAKRSYDASCADLKRLYDGSILEMRQHYDQSLREINAAYERRLASLAASADRVIEAQGKVISTVLGEPTKRTGTN